MNIIMDMNSKIDYRVLQKHYTIENNILTLIIDVGGYELEGKTISASFSPSNVEVGPLSVVDGLIHLQITAGMIEKGVNNIQFTFRWGDYIEQSGKLVWVIDESLVGTTPSDDTVDIISTLIALTTNAIEANNAITDVEALRVLAENSRVTVEGDRVIAEGLRVDAESTRAITFEGYDDRVTIVETEIIDARVGETSLGEKIRSVDTQFADLAKVGLSYTADTGDERGLNAVDLQKSRSASNQVAGGLGSFIAGGKNNIIQNINDRAANATQAHVEGLSNKAYNWQAHAEGSNTIVDGKISHAEGNTTICTANDSHAEGNRTVVGRRYYYNISSGSEDAGDGLGVLQYVLVPNVESDITSYFPNALISDIETRYGAGAQKDIKGNIYASGFTPAIWTDELPTTLNDLTWAMHPFCILRGSAEIDVVFAKIAKCIYVGGVGTKIYYFGNKPFGTLIGVYSSYSPVLLRGGNGSHAEGIFTSAWGDGAHVEGYFTRAWNHYTHAEGYYTKADGIYSSHAEGFETNASGNFGSHSEGYRTNAIGIGSHAEGYIGTASGDYGAHSEGSETIASGSRSHAQGRETEASGEASHSSGRDSVASRNHQEAYGVGKITTKGDNQTSRIAYKHTLIGVGWHVVNVFTAIENGKAYHFETMVLGRQTAGTAELIGNTFAYRFRGCFVKNTDGTFTVIGTPERTLVGRSTGMSGDGLTTGVRLAWSASFISNAVHLRYDGVANTTFSVTTNSTIQEMGL